MRVNEYGAQALTFIGGSGTAAIMTDSAQATIFVGSGSLTVGEPKGAGAVTYNFNEAIGGGTVTISDFRPSEDSLVYSGFTGNPIASESVSRGSLHITLQNHTAIVLSGETRV